jgi:hypothetical protein
LAYRWLPIDQTRLALGGALVRHPLGGRLVVLVLRPDVWESPLDPTSQIAGLGLEAHALHEADLDVD